jgi:D-sedoheptulose 7-phosphate isomerase
VRRAHGLGIRRRRSLFTFGNGGSACDAEHLALEFLHPVIEKRPALPAIALTGEPAGAHGHRQ